MLAYKIVQIWNFPDREESAIVGNVTPFPRTLQSSPAIRVNNSKLERADKAVTVNQNQN